MQNYNLEFKEEIAEPVTTTKYPPPDVHFWTTYYIKSNAPNWLINLFMRLSNTLNSKYLKLDHSSFKCNDMSIAIEIIDECLRFIPIDENASLDLEYNLNVNNDQATSRYITTKDLIPYSTLVQKSLFNTNIALYELGLNISIEFKAFVTEGKPKVGFNALINNWAFYNDQILDSINKYNSELESSKMLYEVWDKRDELDIPPYEIRIMTNGHYRLVTILSAIKVKIMESIHNLSEAIKLIKFVNQVTEVEGYFKYEFDMYEETSNTSDAFVHFVSLNYNIVKGKFITLISKFNQNNRQTYYTCTYNGSKEELIKFLDDRVREFSQEIEKFNFA